MLKSNLTPVEIDFLSNFNYPVSQESLPLSEKLTTYVEQHHPMNPKVNPKELTQKIKGASTDDLNELIQLIKLYRLFAIRTIG